MEAGHTSKLERLREGFQRTIPWAEAMLRALARDHFVLTHIRHVAGPTWFVRAAPPVAQQEGFGLAPEVLVVAVGGEVQARDLHEASGEVVRSGLRLDGNLVIVADQDTCTLAGRLERIGGHGLRIAWGSRSDSTWPSLVEVLRAELPSFDAYEERDPIRGAQLIGRDAEVAILRARVVRGDAVGLFGLRKMGKTSVMRAVTDRFDPASGLKHELGDADILGEGIAVVIDASTIIDRTVDAVADELNAALARRMRSASEKVPHSDRNGLAGWKVQGEALLDLDYRLCVVIDEYDLLFEGESGGGPIPGIGRLFRLLRGWAQTRQGRVSLILVGRDPTHLAAPELEGVTNPLAAWCTPMWLGPLTPEKAVELLRKLGRRVGLRVGHASAALAQWWTGGHPLLHRQFGSALRTATRAGNHAWGAFTDPYIDLAPIRFKEREAVLEVMREVVALLQKRYPGALEVLLALARDVSWEHALADFGGSEGQHGLILRNFGLVSADGGLGAGLAWYLNERAPVTRRSRKEK